MDMDDDNAPDDHGIFTALGTSHSSGDGDFNDKSSATSEMLLDDQHVDDIEDGSTVIAVGADNGVSPDGVNVDQLTFRMIGLDGETDEQGIEVVAMTAAETEPETDVDLADKARRQLNKLEKTTRGKRSMEKSTSKLDSSQPAVKNQASPDAKGSVKMITMEIIQPAGSNNSNDLIKSMQSRLSQKLDSKFVTPIKPIPKVEFTGTIEIPKDLIIATDDDIETATFIISDVPMDDDADASPLDAASSLPDADLLAILEGNDEEAAVEDVESSGALDKSSEMELAMQQIMSLPRKRKGRPSKKVVPGAVAAAPSTRVVKSKNLVESLVQDWSGSDSDSTAPPPKNLNKLPKKEPAIGGNKTAPTEQQPAAFKRTRIIKKKVIWDPDAPETAISYASLVQPSASGIKKPIVAAAATAVPPVAKGAPRILNKIPASQDSGSAGSRSPPLLAKRRIQPTPPSPSGAAQRKRKVSEVDRLLGDEGAINMLNALKRDSLERDEHNDSVKDDAAAEHADNSTSSTHSPSLSQKVADERATTSQRAVRAKRPQTPATASTPPAAAVKKEAAAKRPKKGANAAASSADSWDYIYSNRNDDSLIIRRRSNSSYSSSASTNHRLSIDAPGASPTVVATSAAAPKSTKAARLSAASASFEFAKPNARRSASASDSNADATTMLMDIRSKTTTAVKGTAAATAAETRRSKRGGNANTSAVGDEESDQQPQLNAKERKIVAKLSTSGVMTTLIKTEKTTASTASVASPTNAAKQSEYREIELKRRDGVVHIVLQPFSGQLVNVFTLPMMREVCKALQSLTDDATCKVVLISSATATFCNGLDYSTLQQQSSEKRRTAAEDLASGLSQFIESLASFPKTLVAAVHGRCVGLGVTILPLFDLVLAQKASTFETPYARSGQLPEACSVLQLSTRVSHNAKTKLLLLAETLSVETAQQSQLVTKILPANGFDAEVQRQVAAVADLSVQALDAMKAVAQSAELISLPIRLADEQKILQQHWSSAEWQDAFKRYLNTSKW